MKLPTLGQGKLPTVTNGAAKKLVINTAKPRTPLAALAEAPDPLDESKYPKDPAQADKVELNQMQLGFQQRAKQEAERFKMAGATDFYTVLVFEDGTQCTAFLKAVGMHNQRSGDMYIDGRVLAEHLGIELPAAKTVYNPNPRIDAKLRAMVRKP